MLPSSKMPQTRWDWLDQLKNHDADSEEARHALALLCEGYWYPLYAFLRVQGVAKERAEDLVQSFFEKLLRTKAFLRADPQRGRLRSMLLVALKRHKQNWDMADQAIKRHQPADFASPIDCAGDWAEDRFQKEAVCPAGSPEETYNRQWWQLVLEEAMRNIRSGFASRGKDSLFVHLSPFLEDHRPGGSKLKDVAEILGMKDTAVRVALIRLRKQLETEVLSVLERITGSRQAALEELQALGLNLTQPTDPKPMA